MLLRLGKFYHQIFLAALILLKLGVAIAQDDTITSIVDKNDEGLPSSYLPQRNALDGDLAAQIVTMVFLMLALLDYTIYFLLFLYVFLFVLFESKSFGKFLFTAIIIILFASIRLTFLPLIPFDWAPKFPNALNQFSFYACTVSYIVFFNAPILASLYYIFKFGVKGDKLKSGIISPDTNEVPMVVTLMPIYNEEPIPLFRAVESAIRSDYPPERMHLFLSFDDETESSLYWALLKKLRVLNTDVSSMWQQELKRAGLRESDDGVFLFPPRLELTVEGVRVTICRFPHGGKSATQGQSFKVINEIYGQDETSAQNTLIMFVDSDIILHDNALYNFVATLVRKPHMRAVTGYITCRTSDGVNLLHYLQDAEYLEGQMYARCLEAVSGSVTCLPGALTMMRLNALASVAPKYFIEFDKRKPLNFHRYYLGEDRYMTHLLMELADRPYTLDLCGAARCKTDAPDSWLKLIKQRRRWYLGALINETHMLASPRLWYTMTPLLLLKLFDYASGSLAWLFLVYLVGVAKAIVPLWTLCVFFPCLFLKYFLLSLNASFMNRYKVFISFPVFFLVAPIFKIFCTLYCIWTWDTRSWGGPRTDVTEAELSKVNVMEDLMRRRQQTIKRSKKMLRQIKKRSRIVQGNLEAQNIAVTDEKAQGNEAKGNVAAPLKKLLPFPYEVEILGGGEYFEDLIPAGVPIIQFEKETLEPPNPEESVNGSATNLNATINSKYVFGRFQQANSSRSSFSLDVASLSRMERLTRGQDEMQTKEHTFSHRISHHLPIPFSDGQRSGSHSPPPESTSRSSNSLNIPDESNNTSS